MGRGTNEFVSEFSQKLGQRIMSLRGEMSQEKLGELCGVSREIIQHWERGSRQIKAENLMELAKALDVSADYLLGLSDCPSPTMEEQAICKYTGLSIEALQNLHIRIRGDDHFEESVSILNGFLSDPTICLYLMRIKHLKNEIAEVSENTDAVSTKIEDAIKKEDFSTADETAREFWAEKISRKLKHSARDIVDEFADHLNGFLGVRQTIEKCEELEYNCLTTFSML